VVLQDGRDAVAVQPKVDVRHPFGQLWTNGLTPYPARWSIDERYSRCPAPRFSVQLLWECPRI
jgi:hypothetical protein